MTGAIAWPQRWPLAVTLAVLSLSHQSVDVHALADSVDGVGPLGSSHVTGQHRALQTYTSSATAQSLLLEAVNAERVKAGVATLCGNAKLHAAARLHSQDQAVHDFMSHIGSTNSTMIQRVEAQGFEWSALGENVAADFSTVASVMAAWMNSTGHRANILNDNYTFFGGGYAYNASSTYGHYWTQNFGTGSTEECASSSTATPTPAPSGNQSESAMLTSGPVALNGVCGSDKDGASACITGAYCQPWTPTVYECIAVPEGSQTPDVNVDYFGDDMHKVRGLDPHACVRACLELDGCAAYTFVNANADGQTACYLKSGKGTRKAKAGAVSAVIVD